MGDVSICKDAGGAPNVPAMSKHSLMKDPAYAQMLYAVESRLAELDRAAAAQNITLTDSNVRSIYVRAANIAKGKSPAKVNAPQSAPNTKDEFVDYAVAEISKVRETILEEHDLPDGGVERRPLRASVWIDILSCLKESCEIRTSPTPGSRGYLDMMADFLKQK